MHYIKHFKFSLSLFVCLTQKKQKGGGRGGGGEGEDVGERGGGQGRIISKVYETSLCHALVFSILLIIDLKSQSDWHNEVLKLITPSPYTKFDKIIILNDHLINNRILLPFVYI